MKKFIFLFTSLIALTSNGATDYQVRISNCTVSQGYRNHYESLKANHASYVNDCDNGDSYHEEKCEKQYQAELLYWPTAEKKADAYFKKESLQNFTTTLSFEQDDWGTWETLEVKGLTSIFGSPDFSYQEDWRKHHDYHRFYPGSGWAADAVLKRWKLSGLPSEPVNPSREYAYNYPYSAYPQLKLNIYRLITGGYVALTTTGDSALLCQVSWSSPNGQEPVDILPHPRSRN